MNIMRLFLLGLFLIVFSAHGVPIPGTVVLDSVTLGDTTATNKHVGATVEMKGTPKQVASIAERNLIPTARRTEGMECWVIDVATAYRLIGGVANANWVEVTSSASSLVTNIPAPRIRKISQIVSLKNQEALSNELVIARFAFTGGPAIGTIAYNPRDVGAGRTLFIRDAMQTVEAYPHFFRADQLRGWARAFTNSITGIDLFCSEVQQSGANGYGPMFDSQFDFVWLVYEHYRKTRGTTLFLEMQPRIEASIARTKTYFSNDIPVVSLATMGGWGFHDTLLAETNYNVGLDIMSSMFWIRTCRQLAEMYNASGQFAKGSNALVDLSRTSASVMTNLWDDSRGMFRSYELSITNHSVIGSALAVVYNAVPVATQERIITELISGLPGGEDYAAGNGFFLRGGIRFWPANEQPAITNSQNGGYWPGFTAYVARAIQYDNPELAEHIVSFHLTNTVRQVASGVTNHMRIGQLEWFPSELAIDPPSYGYPNNIQSQAGGVVEPVSTEVYSGTLVGDAILVSISSSTNGPLPVAGEMRFGGGTLLHTPIASGIIMDNGTTTSPSVKFMQGDTNNYTIGAHNGFLRIGFKIDEVGALGLGLFDNVGHFSVSGGFIGDGSGLTNLTIIGGGSTGMQTNQFTTNVVGSGIVGPVTFSNTVAVVGETTIGGGIFAHTVMPGLRLDNGETTTPSIRFPYGNNLNFGIDSDSLTLRFAANLHEAGGTVLGRWQSDGLLLANGGFLAAGGVFTGDGSGLTNVSATATPAGSDGNVQYNNAGVTGGENALFWDDTNDRLGINTTAPDIALEINHATGSNLQLTYNDSNGSAANKVNFATSASGDLTITPSGLDTTHVGNLLFSPDNTYDIGAAGATRPRNAFFGGVVRANFYAESYLRFASGGFFLGISDGVAKFTDDSTSVFGTVQLGALELKQRTAPSAATDAAFIYSKDVSGTAQLFGMSEAGTEYQLTPTQTGSSPFPLTANTIIATNTSFDGLYLMVETNYVNNGGEGIALRFNRVGSTAARLYQGYPAGELHVESTPFVVDNSLNIASLGSAGILQNLVVDEDGNVTTYGTSFPGTGRSLKVDTTATGNVGAGTDDLISYSIPAGLLAANGDYIEFDVHGTCAANANSKQITVNYGGTTLIDGGAVVLNGVSWKAHGKIIRTGATTQTANCELTVGGTLLSAVNGTICLTTSPGETLSGAVTFKCTGTSTVAPNDNDIVQNGMVIKWYPGQ